MVLNRGNDSRNGGRLGGCGKKTAMKLTITNVSYDPTREFYENTM